MNIELLFEILFPPSPDIKCFRSNKEELLKSTTLYHTKDILYLLPYEKNSTRALIHLIKFHYHRDAQKTLAQIFNNLLPQTLSNHTFIPIPLSSKRFRERGYNQVTEILKCANKTNPIDINTNTLKRIRHTTPQTDLSGSKRRQNLKDAFVVTKPQNITGKNIVLVDDVYTTGTTIETAKKVILEHKPTSLTCLTFAH